MSGADLSVMEADTLRMRPKRPFVFTNMHSGEGVDVVARFIEGGGRPQGQGCVTSQKSAKRGRVS